MVRTLIIMKGILSMQDVVLYGTGSEFHQVLDLLKQGGYRPLCVVDNRGRGEFIEKIKVINIRQIVEFDASIIVITSAFFDRAYCRLRATLGRTIEKYEIYVAPYTWLMLVDVDLDETLKENSRRFVDHHRDELIHFFDETDEMTYNILKFIINSRLDGYKFYRYSQVAGMEYVDGYFSDGELNQYSSFTFVDVGAYIGDTYEYIQKMYGKKLEIVP